LNLSKTARAEHISDDLFGLDAFFLYNFSNKLEKIICSLGILIGKFVSLAYCNQLLGFVFERSAIAFALWVSGSNSVFVEEARKSIF